MKEQDKQRKQMKPILKDAVFLLSKIAVLVLFLLLIFGVVFGIYRCNDHAMSPACKDGDLAIVYRLEENFHPSDVIVLEKDGERQIRRVIAAAGDVVDITEKGLVINGYLQQEPDIFTDTLPYEEGIPFPITLGEGEYFVLGDNRPQSTDSRIYGAVRQDEIKGIVITLIRRRGI